jgi:hypothetical protein
MYRARSNPLLGLSGPYDVMSEAESAQASKDADQALQLEEQLYDEFEKLSSSLGKTKLASTGLGLLLTAGAAYEGHRHSNRSAVILGLAGGVGYGLATWLGRKFGETDAKKEGIVPKISMAKFKQYQKDEKRRASQKVT